MENIIVYNDSIFEYVLSNGSINDAVAFLVLLHKDRLSEKLLPKYLPTWNLERTIKQIYEEDVKQQPSPLEDRRVDVETYLKQREEEKINLEKWWKENGGKKKSFGTFRARLNRFKKSLVRNIEKSCREDNSNGDVETRLKNALKRIVRDNPGLLI